MAIYFLIGAIGAIWAAAVASSKNNNAVVYGLIGFLIPLLGVICAYVAAPTEEPKRA